MKRTVSARPSNTASPIRKWPILSSTISRQRRDRLGAGIVEAVAGMHFQAEALREHARRRGSARHSASAASARALRQARRTRRRCESRSPARRAPPPPRSAPARAPMNSETRMPACVELAHRRAPADRAGRRRRARLRWCAPCASPAPGRRRAAWSCSAIASISSVAAISKLSGLSISAFSRAMSSSRMWRRSSRRCAVMPSAPAAMASLAARTGSGWRPPRALRMVAT